MFHSLVALLVGSKQNGKAASEEKDVRIDIVEEGDGPVDPSGTLGHTYMSSLSFPCMRLFLLYVVGSLFFFTFRINMFLHEFFFSKQTPNAKVDAPTAANTHVHARRHDSPILARKLILYAQTRTGRHAMSYTTATITMTTTACFFLVMVFDRRALSFNLKC